MGVTSSEPCVALLMMRVLTAKLRPLVLHPFPDSIGYRIVDATVTTNSGGFPWPATRIGKEAIHTSRRIAYGGTALRWLVRFQVKSSGVSYVSNKNQATSSMCKFISVMITCSTAPRRHSKSQQLPSWSVTYPHPPAEA